MLQPFFITRLAASRLRRGSFGFVVYAMYIVWHLGDAKVLNHYNGLTDEDISFSVGCSEVTVLNQNPSSFKGVENDDC